MGHDHGVERPVLDVRWKDGSIEYMFGAEDYEPDLAALQDKVCEADQVTVVAHPGEGGPPHDVHLYMQYDGRTVWAGVMNRPDRQFRLDEIAVALAEWRTRRGGSCPSVFRVEWWTPNK